MLTERVAFSERAISRPFLSEDQISKRHWEMCRSWKGKGNGLIEAKSEGQWAWISWNYCPISVPARDAVSLDVTLMNNETSFYIDEYFPVVMDGFWRWVLLQWFNLINNCSWPSTLFEWWGRGPTTETKTDSCAKLVVVGNEFYEIIPRKFLIGKRNRK